MNNSNSQKMYTGAPRIQAQSQTRIPDLLDTLKAEYESLIHDVKMQRDDYDRKCKIVTFFFNN